MQSSLLSDKQCREHQQDFEEALNSESLDEIQCYINDQDNIRFDLADPTPTRTFDVKVNSKVSSPAQSPGKKLVHLYYNEPILEHYVETLNKERKKYL